jgi:predicted DNA-binding protein (MmcQ/YjbR family)
VRKTAFDRLSEICLALPDTKLTMPWGSPHFRVGEKIFCGCDEDENGALHASFKLEPSHGEVVLHDPRFRRAAYVGRYGWVTMDLSRGADWGEVEALVRESYRLIAPKKSREKLESVSAVPRRIRAARATRGRPRRRRA